MEEESSNTNTTATTQPPTMPDLNIMFQTVVSTDDSASSVASLPSTVVERDTQKIFKQSGSSSFDSKDDDEDVEMKESNDGDVNVMKVDEKEQDKPLTDMMQVDEKGNDDEGEPEATDERKKADTSSFSDEDLDQAMKDVDQTLTTTVIGQEEAKMNDTTKDLVNVKKLIDLSQAIMKAGNVIAGQDVLLLIGGTGAGKTTTTLHLAGVKFEEIEVDGLEHYAPVDLPDHLAEFAVTGGSKSVTKSIHATEVKLESGESLFICDTPGFGDSAGVEMDIANGLGIIHALRRAKTVKPVLVLNHGTMRFNRYQGLRETLGTGKKLFGNIKSFKAFMYAFSHCEGKSKSRVHKELSAFLRDNPDEDEAMKALIEDMIQKVRPTAMAIDPEECEEASNNLKMLWEGERLEDPSTSFVNFISDNASDRLMRQLTLMLERMEDSLTFGNVTMASKRLTELSGLADVVPLSETKEAHERGKSKWSAFVKQTRSAVESLVEEMVSMRSTATTDADAFKQRASLLRAKLHVVSEMNEMCRNQNTGNVTDVAEFVENIANKLFQKNRVLRIPDDVSKSAEQLQTIIRCHCSLVDTFYALVDTKNLNGETWHLINNLFGAIESELIRVSGFTSDEPMSVPATMKDELLFLLEMKTFFGSFSFPSAVSNTTEKRCLEFTDSVDRLLDELYEKTRRGPEYLEKAANSMESQLELVDTWTAQFFELPSMGKELVGARALLIMFISSETLREATNLEEFDYAALVDKFDKALLSFLPNVANFTQQRADDLRDNGLDAADKIEVSVKEAQDLLEIVKCANETVNIVQEIDSGLVVKMKTSFAGTEATLKGVLKDASNTGKRQYRSAASKGKVVALSEDEIAELESTPHGKKWYAVYKELLRFIRKNGHCCPTRYDPKTKSLGFWVKNQRILWNKDKLPEERETALNKLGFVWDGSAEKLIKEEEDWNKNFELLKKFKERHGHFPPQSVKPLGSFLHYNRVQLKKWDTTGKYRAKGQAHLAEERFEKFKSIGAINW